MSSIAALGQQIGHNTLGDPYIWCGNIFLNHRKTNTHTCIHTHSYKHTYTYFYPYEHLRKTKARPIYLKIDEVTVSLSMKTSPTTESTTPLNTEIFAPMGVAQDMRCY